jgi:uncharacterized membrane protein YozB (DUF420 family)
MGISKTFRNHYYPLYYRLPAFSDLNHPMIKKRIANVLSLCLIPALAHAQMDDAGAAAIGFMYMIPVVLVALVILIGVSACAKPERGRSYIGNILVLIYMVLNIPVFVLHCYLGWETIDGHIDELKHAREFFLLLTTDVAAIIGILWRFYIITRGKRPKTSDKLFDRGDYPEDWGEDEPRN